MEFPQLLLDDRCRGFIEAGMFKLTMISGHCYYFADGDAKIRDLIVCPYVKQSSRRIMSHL
ncbi:hypothetical protein A8B84_20520 [Marinobacter sp. EhC06]|nr:hypothetical protein A8B84_20520 [Marinobacter sp. EhC06]OAN93101.1 hypothetical protein A8B80_17835 [Marinobacter sp. EhN04]